MKYKLKIIPKLLVFVAFLSLTNCSKDEFHEHIKNSKNKYDISFEQFKKETGLTDFKTTISVTLNSNTSSARNADGSYELTDFEIDTEIIKRIELNAKVTYTFATKPIVDASENSIYNLIIYNKNGVWESTIVEYIPTEESYEELINGTAKTIKGTMKLLFETHTSITSCTEITIVTYEPDDPCVGDVCDAREGLYCPRCADYLTVTLCTTDEYGNTNGGVDIGVPVDSGSYGGGTHINVVPTTSAPTAITESILTTPNLEGLNMDYLNPATTPCEELKHLASPTKANVKPEVDRLKAEVNSPSNPTNPSEIGFGIKKKADPIDGTFTYHVNNATSTGNHSMDIPTQNDDIGGGHIHTKNGYPMFSFVDVRFLRDAYLSASYSRKPEVFFMLVCKNQATGITHTYAIKVNDYAFLNNQVQTIWEDSKYASFLDEDIRTKEILKDQQKKYNNCNGDYEKSFFQQYGGLGLSLYEATDDSLLNWNKLELGPDPSNPANIRVSSTPCSN